MVTVITCQGSNINQTTVNICLEQTEHQNRHAIFMYCILFGCYHHALTGDMLLLNPDAKVLNYCGVNPVYRYLQISKGWGTSGRIELPRGAQVAL